MLGHRKLTSDEYIEIVKRRAPLILACVVLLLPISVGVSYVLPPTYESQTLILVQQQVVPQDYVKPVVEESLDAQLSSLKEQILSRSRLEPIITRYNLFADHNRTMDVRVAMTRKAIKITKIQSTDGRGGMPGFFVAFDAHDPRTAQLVCGEITSLFVSENLKAREENAEGTTDFLKQQLSDAKRTLDEQDARLAAFQEKYLGRLPDEQSSNTNTLQALTTQLDATTQSITQMQQNESFLQSMISQAKRSDGRADSPVAITKDERQKQLESLIQQKSLLETQFTSIYPDVIAVSRKIAELEAGIKKGPPPKATKQLTLSAPSDSPELQHLEAQLNAVQRSLVPARQEQARIQQQIRVYESRIEQSPMVEEQYKQITRDHETALQFYNSLLTKMNESSMATALEQRQQGEQFSVMDPPNLPETPKFPNHIVFAVGGLMGGLALGVLISGLLEYWDTSVRSEADVWAFTQLPTLAVVSYINDLPSYLDERPRGWRLFPRRKKPAESTSS